MNALHLNATSELSVQRQTQGRQRSILISKRAYVHCLKVNSEVSVGGRSGGWVRWSGPAASPTRPPSDSGDHDYRHVRKPALVVRLVLGAESEVVGSSRQIHFKRLERSRHVRRRLADDVGAGSAGEDRPRRAAHVVAGRGPARSVIAGGGPVQSHRTGKEVRLEDLDLRDLGGVEAPR